MTTLPEFLSKLRMYYPSLSNGGQICFINRDDEGANKIIDDIATFLSMNTEIKDLVVKRYFTNDYVVQTLVQSLAFHPSIARLCIEGKVFTGTGMKDLTDLFRQQQLVITRLDLVHCYSLSVADYVALFDSLQYNSKIVHLSVTTSFGDIGLYFQHDA
jgi:hypothetical protein